MDPHSFSRPWEARIAHLSLKLKVDFDTEVLTGVATYRLERTADADTLMLDLHKIEIQNVTAPTAKGTIQLSWGVEPGNDYGDALYIVLEEGVEELSIEYSTSPDANALQWLKPEQTLGRQQPFLFTQGQAILTRSWIPIQDSPSIRITYDALVEVPSKMLALMSAKNPQSRSDDGRYYFEMPQAIPPYLIALAVGDIAYSKLGSRSGVYAEPGMLARAAKEFEDVEDMILAAETLYGPYAWGRYDILVLPPSFPFGGMENPRLTFATPTIIAGDKSLTSLIAHELAHSWSGNLVTNATWNDFWLNEGFTVYFEKRIMESLYGPDYVEMLNQLDYYDLQRTIERIGPESPDTWLKLNLAGRNPDDGMNDIAYDKGYLFLRQIEELAGRITFDSFLRQYFDDHAFQTITTEAFLEYLAAELFPQMDSIPDVEAWVYAPGLPEGHPVPSSSRLESISEQAARWVSGQVAASELKTEAWSTHEYLYFLRKLPADLDAERMQELDIRFGFSLTGNSEIAATWYTLAAENGFEPAFEPMAGFLTKVGRRKFLVPIYEALASTPRGKERALEIYEQARPNYHSVSKSTLDEMLGWEPAQ